MCKLGSANDVAEWQDVNNTVKAVGIDGCRAGWVCAHIRDGNLQLDVALTFRAVLERFQAAVIAIDIPIGLPERGDRACDRAARRLLGRRGCTVFSAPIRPLLEAQTYDDACREGRRIEGRAVSRQCWGIMPKIREVDAAITPDMQSRIIEVHPEVSFCAMNSLQPVMQRKSESDGRAVRTTLLGDSFGVADVPRPVGATMDDVSDALAALWSGMRHLSGRSRCVSRACETDVRGLKMEIHY